MSAKANYFKIGLFVIIALLIIFITVIIFGAGTLFQKRFILETYFDGSVQGLEMGAPIKYRGVKVGEVVDINTIKRFYKTDKNYIIVRMALDPKKTVIEYKTLDEFAEQFVPRIKEQIEKGMRVRMASMGITGVAFLEVDYLKPEQFPSLEIDWEPEHPYVPSAPSKFAEITESLTRITKKIEELELKELISDARKTLHTVTAKVEDVDTKGISDNTVTLLKEVRVTDKRLKQILDKPEIDDIFADTKELVASLREKLPGTIDEARGNVIVLKRTLRRIDSMIASHEYDINVLFDDIRQISENVKQITESLKKNPSGFIFGAPPAKSKPGGGE